VIEGNVLLEDHDEIAINLIAGQLNGLSAMNNNVVDSMGNLIHKTHEAFADSSNNPANLTVIGDADPLYDVCSNAAIDQVTMAGCLIGVAVRKLRACELSLSASALTMPTVNAAVRPPNIITRYFIEPLLMRIAIQMRATTTPQAAPSPLTALW
jgi:hypothetical protein